MNSQAAHAKAQDRIDRQCGRPRVGLDVPINSIQSDFYPGVARQKGEKMLTNLCEHIYQ